MLGARRLRPEDLPGGSRENSSAPKLGFQRDDLAAQRRLGNAKKTRSLSNVQRLCNSD